MEHSALLHLLMFWRYRICAKIIDFSIDYLRAGHYRDTFVQCQVWRQNPAGGQRRHHGLADQPDRADCYRAGPLQGGLSGRAGGRFRSQGPVNGCVDSWRCADDPQRPGAAGDPGLRYQPAVGPGQPDPPITLVYVVRYWKRARKALALAGMGCIPLVVGLVQLAQHDAERLQAIVSLDWLKTPPAVAPELKIRLYGELRGQPLHRPRVS